MNLLKPFISGGSAFIMAIVVAVLIEKLGGAIGSVIGMVPSTIIPVVAIMLTQTDIPIVDRQFSVIASICGMLGSDYAFLPIWRYLPPRLMKSYSNGWVLVITSVVSTVMWFITAIVAYIMFTWCVSKGMNTALFGFLALIMVGLFAAFFCWDLPPAPAGKKKVKWYVHLLRGIIAFIVIFSSGVMSIAGASLGAAAGVIAMFPALFITTLVSVSITQGFDVSSGSVGPLMIGGVSFGWFALISSCLFIYLHTNIVWSLLVGFVIIVVCWTVPVFFYIQWRRRATAKKMVKIEPPVCVEVEMKKLDTEEKDGIRNNNNNETDMMNERHVVAVGASSV